MYTTLQGSTGGRETNSSLENPDFPPNADFANNGDFAKNGIKQLEVETSPKKDEILTVE
jgi:hypothetical protein